VLPTFQRPAKEREVGSLITHMKASTLIAMHHMPDIVKLTALMIQHLRMWTSSTLPGWASEPCGGPLIIWLFLHQLPTHLSVFKTILCSLSELLLWKVFWTFLLGSAVQKVLLFIDFASFGRIYFALLKSTSFPSFTIQNFALISHCVCCYWFIILLLV
jgi:hypothetical protein